MNGKAQKKNFDVENIDDLDDIEFESPKKEISPQDLKNKSDLKSDLDEEFKDLDELDKFDIPVKIDNK